MALEDFERRLAQQQAGSHEHRKRSRSPDDGERRHRKHHHHHRSHRDRDEDRHRHKRPRREERHSDRHGSSKRHSPSSSPDRAVSEQENATTERPKSPSASSNGAAQRQSWMQAPSALDIEYKQSKPRKLPPSKYVKAQHVDAPPELRAAEVKEQLQDLASENKDSTANLNGEAAEREINYTFGDSASHWRMTKLNAIRREAKKSGRSEEDVALERLGDLRDFDDAREEEIELERRDTYGKGYVGKDKPSGELFTQRKLDSAVRKEDTYDQEESEDEFEAAQGEIFPQEETPTTTVALDQTTLNKLKAQMMKAKLQGGPEAATLEAEYNTAVASSATSTKQPDVVVLNKMESRMLAGGRQGEVTHLTNKRGLERGLVEENEDMSIEDMVRHERRTRKQGDSSAQNFADRIARDGMFTNDLEYMDDNALKLSRTVAKSDVNLRTTAIEDYKRTKQILDTCPLCHHEDTSPPTPPAAPIVSLATRTYLTLPTSPEITPYGLCASIVPITHHTSLLDCDDDEWEEIRNFQKSLSRFYYNAKPGYTIIFYENAAHSDGRKRHAAMEAVPLPLSLADTAPAFFREAILANDEEWTQHRPLIDTAAKARDGAGKLAFRRSMVSELPYFHVWFTLDGGLGHVVEDGRRWPKGDLFAREVVGGMLDVGVEVVKRQGRWRRGDQEMEGRVRKFRKGWETFDWTAALMDA